MFFQDARHKLRSLVSKCENPRAWVILENSASHPKIQTKFSTLKKVVDNHTVCLIIGEESLAKSSLISGRIPLIGFEARVSANSGQLVSIICLYRREGRGTTKVQQTGNKNTSCV